MRNPIKYFPLIVLMCLCVRISAFKVGNFSYSIISEEDHTVSVGWGSNYTTIDTLVIPDTVSFEGKFYAVTEIRGRSFERLYHLNIKSAVIIPPSIRKIGEAAFSDHPLTHVTIPDSVDINRFAFIHNLWIRELNLGEGCNIQLDAFAYNAAATELYLPPGTTIDLSFYAWNHLEKLEIAENVNIVNALFGYRNCSWEHEADPRLYPEELCGAVEKPLTVIYHTSNPQYIDYSRTFPDKTYEEGVLYMEDEEGVENARITYPWSQFQNILPLSQYNGVNGISTADNNAPEEIFTISGLPVNTPKEVLPKGIYILRKGLHSSKFIVP